MELDNFVNELKEYQTQPSGQVWDRLEHRLSESKVKRSLRFYKYLVAASFVGLVAMSYAYVDHMYKDHTPGQFATNEQYSFLMLEELDGDDNTGGIYSISSVVDLHNAYKQFSTKSLKVKE